MKKVTHTTHKPVSKVEVKEVKTETNDALVKNNWLPIAVVGALVVVFLFLKFFKGDSVDLVKMKNQTIPTVVKKVVNNPNSKVEIVSAKESSGVVEFVLKVNGQQYTSYLTKDAKILFTSGITVDQLNKQPAAGAEAETKKVTAADIKKADKPLLTAFVVANCPYGLQMQRVFKKAMAELPDLASNLAVKYIGSVSGNKLVSMHGDKEAEENLKQICIREEQNDKYWPYVGCYMQEGNTEGCLNTSGVNLTQMNACVSDTNRGVKYAQADFDLANKMNVSGSPTLLVNNNQVVSEFDFGGRNPNAIKDIVCASGTNKPGYCSNAISKDDVAVSLSTTDAPAPNSGSTNSAAGCAPAK